ncbi:2Fe-2S iron-sulfur cluster-binding protein [Prochlorococcus marinus]|uniref:Ferredoxin n=1 Tax=Prochlorococcus marinus str. PAC1 TaxID=59924 RepID=A0A0A2C7V2_PROMR|nr:2Fe-2S iron-sulfur cluster-binding protein [Prochlorococcus marinus]KGG22446.1 Ferredoxin [Prochlorococcus marinus str. PAC1]
MSDLLFKINIEIDQVQQNFDFKSEQAVLEAAADANIVLPSSCIVGMCCTCAVFLKEGSVDMEAMGLKSELQEQGYVLLCQAYPKSDLKIVANQFDAAWDQQ